MDPILSHMEDVKKLCTTHRVSHLYAFGSVLTDDFGDDSDIDLLVEFERMDPSEYADNFFDFKFSLQRIFGRPVDLLEDKAIKNPFFRKSVDMQKSLIYGR
jgi:predicted nucleotidyltransferase